MLQEIRILEINASYNYWCKFNEKRLSNKEINAKEEVEFHNQGN